MPLRQIPTVMRTAVSLAVAIGLSAVAPGAARAQTGGPPPVRERPASSPFNLTAFGDLAMMGIRSAGDWGMCFTNMGVNGPNDQGCGFADAIGTRTRMGGVTYLYDEISFYIAAGPSDLPPQINRQRLIGGGWTVNRSTSEGRVRKLMPSDRSGMSLLNVEVVTTDDGSCRDSRGILAGYVAPDRQMLPSLRCPESWPASGFGGDRLIDEESFLSFALSPEGARDPFAFWRIPNELRSPDRYLGEEQLYGEFADWTSDLRAQYGAVLPGGTGDPTLPGWPLGVTVFFNAYYHSLPTLNNAYFWQATIVNDSYRLYGDGVDPATGVDYDSLYVGINPIKIFPGNSVSGFVDQFAAQYLDPSRGAVLLNKCGQRGVANNAKDSPYYGSAANCASEFMTGFDAGGLATIFLRSPIGDLRNKLLSDPESPFFDPLHPEADDTITINRTGACGYLVCHQNAHLRSERALFGLLAGITEDWLDGRARTDFPDDQYWNTVHPHDWPNRGDFNVWVPGDWDYNEDGIPDDVRAESCFGVGPNGCVVPWSDTLPGGFLNMGGIFPHWGVGPFSLKSGDTTSLIVAFVWEADSAALEAQIDNVIDFYTRFHFGPEAAPPPSLYAISETGRASSISTVGGSVREASVTLMWDDLGDYRDPFIEDVLQRLLEAPIGTRLGNMRVLNPWLVDSLTARITNNLTAVHLFKSCDNGATFTSDATCFPNRVPPDDQSSKWRDIGWMPYATLSPDVGRITDLSVQPGIHLFYSLVTEKQGAKFNVYVGSVVEEQPPGSGHYVCLSPDCRVEEVEFAPPIMSALRTTITPGGPAVRVYVPLSRQAGYVGPSATFTLPTDRVLPPMAVSLVDDAPSGKYTALFADSVEVVEVHRVDAGEDLGYSTTVRLFTIRNVYDPQSNQTARTIIRERELSGPTQFAMQGATSMDETSEIVDGVTTTIRRAYFSGVTLVLARDGTAPIMATSQFTGGRTTPGELKSSREFPGFMLDIFGADAGSFRNHLAITANNDTLSGANVNTRIVRWLQNTATNLAGYLGAYEVEWLDHPFGPAQQFRLDAGDPTDAVLASLEARNDTERSVAGANAVAALRDAGIDVDELQEYSLPFRVRNVLTGHPVQVAVLQHRESIVMGVGADTFRIFVPTDRWVPGDRLVLIEPIPQDSTIQGGIVLDGAGNPIRVEPVRASWAVTFGCGSFETCNPIAGEGSYLTLEPGTRVRTVYNGHLTSDASFELEVVAASNLGPDSPEIDLSRVAVVPNPYIVYSRFERTADDRVIKFTNLPPSGTIYIYTVSGQLVQRLTYTQEDLQGTSGDLEWNMLTRDNTELAYGLYLFVLESEYGRAAGKFVIIR